MAKMNWSKCRKENYIYKYGSIDKDDFEIAIYKKHKLKIEHKDLAPKKEKPDKAKQKRLNCKYYYYGYCKVELNSKGKCKNKCALLENKKCYKEK